MIPKYQLARLPAELAETLPAHLGLPPAAPLANAREAGAFVRSRLLVSLWGGTELPSLQEAAAGVAVPRMTLASPAVGAAWTWAKALVESGDFACLKMFHNRSTLVARRMWSAIVALAPDHGRLWRAGRISSAAHEISAFLDKEGPASTLELQERLPRRVPMLPASLKKGLRELEEKLVIYPRRLGEHVSGRDVNTWELVRRGLGERVVTKPETRATALRHLLDVVVKSAGVVDKREAVHWLAAEIAEPPDLRATLESVPSAVSLGTSEGDWIIWQGLSSTVRPIGTVAAV